jgi:hypothetical protein
MKFSNVRLYYDTAPDLTVINFDFPIDGEIKTSPFVLRSIDGLGPSDVDLIISSTLYTGSVYQGAHPHNKELILKVGYQPDYSTDQSVSDLRAQLYSLMTPRLAKPLTVEVQDAARVKVVETTGYIKKMEPNIFSQDPEIIITISCLRPHWKKWGQAIDDPGDVDLTEVFTITNPGDAPSGFEMVVVIGATQDDWSMTNLVGETFEVVYDFEAADEITIDTTPGQRSIILDNGVDIIDLLPYLSNISKWLLLDGGENLLATNSTAASVLSEFIINANYWGV